MRSTWMKAALIGVLTVCCYAASSPIVRQANSAEPGASSDSLALQAQAVTIISHNCARGGCHSGRYPVMGHDFAAANVVASTVNVPSAEANTLKLVDPGRPGQSYLVMKIRGDKGIVGARMPREANPLSAADIRTIEDWIASMPAGSPGAGEPPAGASATMEPPPSAAPASGFRTPAFFGRTVINLPTTEPLDKGEILLRIEHRFFFTTKTGYQGFYGLDSPPDILIAFEYGITSRWGVSIGRTNEQKEVDLTMTYTVLEQGIDYSAPVSVAPVAGVTLSTVQIPGRPIWSEDNVHANVAISVSRQFTDRLSVLVVPAFSYNTDYLNPTQRNTFALGFGGRFMFMENGSLVGEYVPAYSGFKTGRDSWTLGLEAKHGGHVFHLFVTNALGLTQNQYLPGADLRAEKEGPRLGFTIYRIK